MRIRVSSVIFSGDGAGLRQFFLIPLVEEREREPVRRFETRSVDKGRSAERVFGDRVSSGVKRDPTAQRPTVEIVFSLRFEFADESRRFVEFVPTQVKPRELRSFAAGRRFDQRALRLQPLERFVESVFRVERRRRLQPTGPKAFVEFRRLIERFFRVVESVPFDRQIPEIPTRLNVVRVRVDDLLRQLRRFVVPSATFGEKRANVQRLFAKISDSRRLRKARRVLGVQLVGST